MTLAATISKVIGQFAHPNDTWPTATVLLNRVIDSVERQIDRLHYWAMSDPQTFLGVVLGSIVVLWAYLLTRKAFKVR